MRAYTGQAAQIHTIQSATAGAIVTKPVANMADFAKRFFDYIDATPKTVETYKRSIKQFAKYLNDRGIVKPQREDIIGYREQLRADGKKASTIQLYMTTLHIFFGYLETEGLYPNIARKIKGAKIDRTTHAKDYLQTQQIKKILCNIDRATAEGKRDYAVMAILLTTGARVIELARADIKDMGIYAGKQVLYVQGKGRQDKNRPLDISAEPVQEAIQDYLNTRTGFLPTEPLFTSTSNNSRGKGLTTRTLSKIAKTTMQRAGFDSERLTAHSTRHTAATLALKNGATLAEVQQMLGHININTTMIYQHAVERENNMSEQRIAQAIFF